MLAYYTAHPDFIWVTDNAINDRARDALPPAARGMAPADYGVSVPQIGARQHCGDIANDLIRFEMALSARAALRS